jgi:hypothetical protein
VRVVVNVCEPLCTCRCVRVGFTAGVGQYSQVSCSHQRGVQLVAVVVRSLTVLPLRFLQRGDACQLQRPLHTRVETSRVSHPLFEFKNSDLIEISIS